LNVSIFYINFVINKDILCQIVVSLVFFILKTLALSYLKLVFLQNKFKFMKFISVHLRNISFSLFALFLAPLIVYTQECARVDFQFEIKENIATFSGNSDSDVLSWRWDFGDNTYGSGQKVRRQYNSRGDYQVCLEIKVSEVCSATVCKKITIGMNESNCNLKVDFDYKTDGKITYFRALSNDEKANYQWYITGSNIQYKGSEIRIPFDKSGTYEVCVIAVNSTETCKARACKQIKINTDPCILEADFEFAVDRNIVKLSAKSTAGTNAKYMWTMGDGNRSDGQQTKYEYKNRGVYEVCLTVTAGQLSTTADQSCTKTICKRVSIGDNKAVECDFKADFAFSVTGNIVTLKGRSSEENTTFQWYSQISRANISGQETRMPFDQAGVYEICLIAVNSDQTCKVHICKRIPIGSSVRVYPNPATDVINVSSDQNISEYSIYNQANEIKLSGLPNTNHISVDISSILTGMYHIQTTLEDGTSSTYRFYKL
jgi:PKD repeat protein